MRITWLFSFNHNSTILFVVSGSRAANGAGAGAGGGDVCAGADAGPAGAGEQTPADKQTNDTSVCTIN